MNVVMEIAFLLISVAGYQDVTVQQLNSTPEVFDGQKVTVSGWIVIDDEKRYIVAQKKNYTTWRKGASCLSVINGGGLDARETDFNGKHVSLRGVFRADVHKDGVVRLGLCSATAIDLENAPIDGKIERTRDASQ
jgi:hypothetical protein